jgi:hypothetical protein
MKNSVRIEPYNNIKYYCFDKKIFYPNEISVSESTEQQMPLRQAAPGIDKLIGKLVSYKGDVYFISFVNANDININSDLLKSPGDPYELINEKQIESCMKKQPYDILDNHLFWSKNKMLSKEFYKVVLDDIIKFRRDIKISNILE